MVHFASFTTIIVIHSFLELFWSAVHSPSWCGEVRPGRAASHRRGCCYPTAFSEETTRTIPCVYGIYDQWVCILKSCYILIFLQWYNSNALTLMSPCSYEGTGRSLSLKLIQQLRQQSADSQQNLSAENRNTSTARLAAGILQCPFVF